MCSQSAVTGHDAHPTNQLGRDVFRIDHGFIRRHIEMQVLLVDSPEGTQVGPKRRTRSLTGVAMHLTLAITIVIPRPFAYTMADRGMGGMTAPVALPFVGVQQHAASGNVFGDEVRHVRVSAWSPTHKRCSPVSREMMLMMGGRSLT